MSNVIPKPKAEQVAFFEDHSVTFAANFASIGISTGQASAFKALADAAYAKWKAQTIAEDGAKNATADFNTALTAARDMCADLIRTIKAYAASSSNPQNVYTLANIPAPASPSPAPPPGLPFEFVCALQPTGELALSWKCTNPPGTSGTVYEVKRRIGTGAFTYIGVTGERVFIDDTVPSSAAVPGVTYAITAIRSTVRGTTAQFLVSFGVGGDGLVSTTVTQVGPTKLAA